MFKDLPFEKITWFGFIYLFFVLYNLINPTSTHTTQILTSVFKDAAFTFWTINLTMSFYHRCLTQWLHENNTCPLCKTAVRVDAGENTNLVNGAESVWKLWQLHLYIGYNLYVKSLLTPHTGNNFFFSSKLWIIIFLFIFV